MKKNQRSLLALAGGTLAVLAVGNAYLRLGWGGNVVRMADTAGDPAALEGFTLSGELIDDAYTCKFTLADGVLTNSAVLEAASTEYTDFAVVTSHCAVDPDALPDIEEHCAIAEATLPDVNGSPTQPGLLYTSRTNRFVQQVTLRLPDDSYAVLHTRRIITQTPLPVSTYRYEDAGFARGWQYLSYLPDGRAITPTEDLTEEELSAYQELGRHSSTVWLGDATTRLNDCWYILAGRSQDGLTADSSYGMTPGVYRVQTVTPEELNSGTKQVMGQSVKGYVPCGSAELVYTVPASATPLGLCAAGGSLCLYYAQDGLLCLSVLSADGAVTDNCVLADRSGVSFGLCPQFDAAQSCASYWSDALARNVSTVVRIRDGRIAAIASLPGAALQGSAPALLLSRDNARLLAVTPAYEDGQLRVNDRSSGEPVPVSAYTTLRTGYLLAVYPSDTGAAGAPLYTARLDADLLQDWTYTYYPASGVHAASSFGPDRFAVWRTLYLNDWAGGRTTLNAQSTYSIQF